jgi:hypothetical protein
MACLFFEYVQFTGDKRGKFSWRGTKDFLMTLGAIQVLLPQRCAQLFSWLVTKGTIYLPR